LKVGAAVRRETLKIALGTAVMTVLMVAVFLIVRRFDWTVLTGALLGYAAAVLNFFLMALTVQKAADDMPAASQADTPEAAPEDTDTEFDEKVLRLKEPLSPGAKKAKQRIQLSYTLRMLLMGGLAILGVVLPCFNSVAVLLPMLFPRIVIAAYGLIQHTKGA